jgi:nitrogen regulatory protein P-II 2
MSSVRMKRVVIIGDNTVEYRLLSEIEALGATGYTYCAVRGKGSRGIRPRRGEPGNTKIEVIATSETAQKIIEHIGENYFEKYAMIAFLDDVEVLHGSMFGAK